jgi:hypothetical protein
VYRYCEIPEFSIAGTKSSTKARSEFPISIVRTSKGLARSQETMVSSSDWKVPALRRSQEVWQL